jgi:hypothetical protein
MEPIWLPYINGIQGTTNKEKGKRKQKAKKRTQKTKTKKRRQQSKARTGAVPFDQTFITPFKDKSFDSLPSKYPKMRGLP